VVYAEEEAFRETLRTGTQMFELATERTKHAGRHELAGDQAFLLHDTFGFPIELTLEMAAEAGLTVDEVGFRQLMQQQRDRAKADARAKKGARADTTAYRDIADSIGRPVEFTGYDEVASEATIRGLITSSGLVGSAGSGEEIELVLDRTPFYAEAGGQPAAQGAI